MFNMIALFTNTDHSLWFEPRLRHATQLEFRKKITNLKPFS